MMVTTQQPKRGLHNWKNLFKKPNGYEWTILIMLILGGVLAYSYKVETATCRDYVNDLPNQACQICRDAQKGQLWNNLTNLSTGEEFYNFTVGMNGYDP